MKRNNFETFVRTLEIVNKYNANVYVKEGIITQMSDDNNCLLHVDMYNVFEDEDAKSFEISDLKSKIPFLKILNGSLVDEKYFVRVKQTDDNKYLRFLIGDSNYYIYNKDLNMDQIESNFYMDITKADYDISNKNNITPKLRETINKIKDKMLLNEVFSPEEYQRIRTLQSELFKTNSINLYYYKGKVLFRSANEYADTVMGKWDSQYEIDLEYVLKTTIPIDVIFPDSENHIVVNLYYDNKTLYVVSATMIGNTVVLNLLSSWKTVTMMTNNEIIAVKKIATKS